ncbi:MAG: DUF4336 domain-containing protein [Nannocystis sp.]|nr:DUF4336 domain-containing protein [Nannocystis sp.]
MSSELKQIARQDLWIVDHPQRMPGGWRMDTRMSVLRLPDGALWLHSVVPIDDALAAQLDALGPVRHLVAPNLLHHLYLGPAQQRWPEAHTWAPPGLSDKRPELRIDHQLAGRAPPSWGGVIEEIAIDGAPGLAESIFFHRPTATLIVADLVFALRTAPNLRTALILWMVGALGGVRQSRLLRAMIRDRAAAAASIRALLALPFERLVPAHGEVIEADAHAQVSGALAWARTR